jgi:uncharacterized protein YydD (DUF2326 family)
MSTELFVNLFFNGVGKTTCFAFTMFVGWRLVKSMFSRIVLISSIVGENRRNIIKQKIGESDESSESSESELEDSIEELEESLVQELEESVVEQYNDLESYELLDVENKFKKLFDRISSL